MRVAAAPPIDRSLKGAVIMFRFGDEVGWCVGRVKRFYSPLFEGKFNAECKYEDGDIIDHTFSAVDYVGEQVVGDDLDKVLRPGAWVVIRKPEAA